MLTLWLIVCFSFAAFSALQFWRRARSGGIVIAGRQISNLTLILAASIIIVAFAFAAMTQLGIITDYAPQ